MAANMGAATGAAVLPIGRGAGMAEALGVAWVVIAGAATEAAELTAGGIGRDTGTGLATRLLLGAMGMVGATGTGEVLAPDVAGRGVASIAVG